MNSRYYRFRSRLFGSVPLLISAFMFSAQHVNAQTGDEGDDAPTINIAGDVYGGGKQGSVGIGNLHESSDVLKFHKLTLPFGIDGDFSPLLSYSMFMLIFLHDVKNIFSYTIFYRGSV